MSVESTTTTRTVAQNLDNAEELLSEREAEKAADEAYLGVADTGTILDVRMDDLDDDTVIEFDIRLPNEKEGVIAFSEYMWDDRGEHFLDLIHSTEDDMEDAYLHEVPVTYTDWNGWVVCYGPQKKQLETTYAGESSLWGIESQQGFPRAKWPIKAVTRSPLLVGALLSVANWSVVPVIIGALLWVFFGYCAVAWAGMSSPYRKSIRVD